MNKEELNNHWHLRREISVGHIISTVLLALMLAGGWVKIQTKFQVFEQHILAPAHLPMEVRVDTLEAEVVRIKVVDANLLARLDTYNQHVSARLDSLQTEIIRRLERIEDRLNEHSVNDNNQ